MSEFAMCKMESKKTMRALIIMLIASILVLSIVSMIFYPFILVHVVVGSIVGSIIIAFLVNHFDGCRQFKK